MTNGNRKLRLLFAASVLIWAGAAVAQGRISSLEVLNKIQPGATTAPQVHELLGAPARTLRFPARGIEVLEYDARDYGRIVVAITVGSDGKVRDISRFAPSHP
jgi:hypothetical protein